MLWKYLKRKGINIKFAIVGSREFDDYKLFKKIIKLSKFKITEICSGGAKGVDSLAEKYAEENNIPIKVFPAEWNNLSQEGAIIKERENPWTKKKEKYCSNAGLLRNTKIINYSECCIAIPLENSRGTLDDINKAKKKGIPIYVYETPEEEKEYDYEF